MPKVELDVPVARWARPLLEPSRYKGASGGRSSGKSHFFAGLAVGEMVCDPDLRFVCIREVQRSLKHSAKSLVEYKIKKLGVSGLFHIMEREIRRVGGSGVMIFEGMQDHTADSLKSLEAFSRAWVEEAHRLSERSMRLLLPTIRTPTRLDELSGRSSEIWFSWNPENPTDPVDKFFRSNPEGAVHAHSTYLDNPFCKPEMVAEAERLKRVDPVDYEHVWLGGYFVGGSGRVYSTYMDRDYPDGNLCEVKDTGAEILVGMDFNVEPMSAVIAVRAGDECHILDAIEIDTSNTEEMAEEIKRRYPDRRIVVCPDPSGNQRKSSAPVGQTDHTILRGYGFEVRAPRKAPPVVDRENNAKAMYYDKLTGRRRCLVHPDAQALRIGLTNLRYKEGTSQRDKKTKGPSGATYDHICDAADYLLWQEFNVLASNRMTIHSVTHW
jgi:PBSX family phage terminase large subunit